MTNLAAHNLVDLIRVTFVNGVKIGRDMSNEQPIDIWRDHYKFSNNQLFQVVEQAVNEYGEVKNVLEATRETLRDTIKERDDVKRELTTTIRQRDGYRQQRDDMIAEHNASVRNGPMQPSEGHQIDVLNKQIAELKNQLAETDKQYGRMQKIAVERAEVAANLSTELDVARAACDKVTGQCDRLEALAVKRGDQINEIAAERDDLRKRLNEISDIAVARADEIAGLKRQIGGGVPSIKSQSVGNYHFVTTHAPGHHSQFVELEDDNGNSVNPGEWIEKGGLHHLVVPVYATDENMRLEIEGLRRECDRLKSAVADAEHLVKEIADKRAEGVKELRGDLHNRDVHIKRLNAALEIVKMTINALE